MSVCRTAQGGCHAFGLDRRFDYLRGRRNLLLGHRQVCQGSSPGKPAQTAGGADLPGIDPAAGIAAGRNFDVAGARQTEASCWLGLVIAQEVQDGEIELPWVLQKGEMAGIGQDQ